MTEPTQEEKLTADDKKLLTAIMDAAEPEQIAARVFDYYHDNDRADRTSRAQMYLHMGMLCGAILRATEGKRMPVVSSRRRSSLDVVGTTGGKATVETKQ